HRDQRTGGPAGLELGCELGLGIRAELSSDEFHHPLALSGLLGWRVDGSMSNDDPPRLLLLPDAHHTARFSRKRLAITRPAQYQRVSHHKGVPVHFGIHI